MRITKNLFRLLLAACLGTASPAGAELIQHLDASVPDSVVTASDGSVKRWTDLSGKGNDALADIGRVTYPSTTKFPGGPAGVEFAKPRASLVLFNSAASDQWLDQSAGKGGFAVLMVTCTTGSVGNWADLIGNNTSVTGGFGIRAHGTSGDYHAYLKGTIAQRNGVVQVGDTCIWALNYDAATGAYELWNSKDKDGPLTGTWAHGDFSTGTAVTLGTTTNASRYFVGLVGEVLIFNAPLSPTELALYKADLVRRWVTPPEEKARAGVPNPADGDTEVRCDGTQLSWKPGLLSSTSDVYFGTDLAAVRSATVGQDPAGVYLGRQSGTSLALPHLELGRTYYWRVDAVAGQAYPGTVWSFTTERFSYPLAPQNITATASSTNSPAEGPENTINRSGLDANDLHATENGQMWVSSVAGAQPTWIQYEFDKLYRLHEMWVWNYNSTSEPVIGYGAKEVLIEYSPDAATWTTLGTTHEFARGSGVAGYAHNTTIDLGGIAAKYVKLTINSNWGGVLKQYGLSEVRFYSVPVVAREPQPASEAANVSVDAVLSWRAGREAAQHQVYLSTDPQAVMQGTAPVATVATAQYQAAVDLDRTYYWKVVEVNEARKPALWAGEVWSFATEKYVVVDDFESYTDDQDKNQAIFQTWSDGLVNPANGGSQVGNDPSPFAEQTIVNSGRQSMPLAYDNTTGTSSEATRTFASPQDWSNHRIKALTLRFYGDPANGAQRMYVKINGIKVLYDGAPEDLLRSQWQMWYIDLTALNVSTVKELTIGFDRRAGAGGKGKVFIDDVRLYPLARSSIVPVDPGTAGLQARYQFEGNFDDNSGHGRKGSAKGNPLFVSGQLGQAINLDGIDDCVNVDGYKGILADAAGVQHAFTVCAWIKTATNGDMVAWGTNTAGQRMNFRVDTALRVEHGGGSILGSNGPSLLDDEWHHVAATVPQGARIMDVLLYVGGADVTPASTTAAPFNLTAGVDTAIGMGGPAGERFFTGLIDEVRLYDRVLSPAEVAALAGRTTAFDKPF